MHTNEGEEQEGTSDSERHVGTVAVANTLSGTRTFECLSLQKTETDSLTDTRARQKHCMITGTSRGACSQWTY